MAGFQLEATAGEQLRGGGIGRVHAGVKFRVP